MSAVEAAISVGGRPTASPLADPSVLHIISGNSLAGAERHVILLARRQIESGWRAHIAFPTGGWLSGELKSLGLRHTGLPLRGTMDVVSLARLVALMRRQRIGLAHGHLARGMFYALAAAACTGAACVATDHMAHPNWVMPHLDHLIELSRGGAAKSRAAGCRAERMSVIPNGVDVSEALAGVADAARMRDTWGVPQGRMVVGLLGRVSAVKGHDLLLLAVAGMPDAERPWLAFAGSEEPAWGARVRALARDLALSQRVLFLGPQKDVGAFLACCDAVAVPSRKEASPMALMEAMAAGRPVVASAVGGILDLADDGRTAILVPAGSPHALGKALSRLLRDPQLRRRLGGAAEREAAAHFTARAMAASTNAVYSALLEARAGKRSNLPFTAFRS
jgi:glycosyltransferase involved in cell wall biosynthesis